MQDLVQDLASLARKILVRFAYFLQDCFYWVMPSLSQMLHPLYQLLRKNVQWSWEIDHQEAFTKVKQLLCQDFMLAHYDVSKPLKLFCDASPNGLGACLVHVMLNGEERPVAYASRSLSQAEQNYAQIEQEALAIVLAVRRFHQYLYGREFTLVTHHHPLCKILGKKGIPPLAAARMQRWALLLLLLLLRQVQ